MVASESTLKSLRALDICKALAIGGAIFYSGFYACRAVFFHHGNFGLGSLSCWFLSGILAVNLGYWLGFFTSRNRGLAFGNAVAVANLPFIHFFGEYRRPYYRDMSPEELVVLSIVLGLGCGLIRRLIHLIHKVGIPR